jgi:hypothetical protein
MSIRATCAPRCRWEQGCGVRLAGRRHRAGRGPRAGLWVVQLGGREEASGGVGPTGGAAAGDQDVSVGEQGRRVAAAGVQHGARLAEHTRPRVVARGRGEGPVARGEAPRDEDAAVGEQRGGLDLPTVAQRARHGGLRSRRQGGRRGGGGRRGRGSRRDGRRPGRRCRCRGQARASGAARRKDQHRQNGQQPAAHVMCTHARPPFRAPTW